MKERRVFELEETRGIDPLAADTVCRCRPSLVLPHLPSPPLSNAHHAQPSSITSHPQTMRRVCCSGCCSFRVQRNAWAKLATLTDLVTLRQRFYVVWIFASLTSAVSVCRLNVNRRLADSSGSDRDLISLLVVGCIQCSLDVLQKFIHFIHSFVHSFIRKVQRTFLHADDIDSQSTILVSLSSITATRSRSKTKDGFRH